MFLRQTPTLSWSVEETYTDMVQAYRSISHSLSEMAMAKKVTDQIARLVGSLL